MSCVTAGIPQGRRAREHYLIGSRERCGRIDTLTPRRDDATDRNVVSARLDAVSRDNLTGIRERSRDQKMSVDEEDTLPYSSIDREITGRKDDGQATRA